jgi:hypothetical protein
MTQRILFIARLTNMVRFVLLIIYYCLVYININWFKYELLLLVLYRFELIILFVHV